MQRVVLCTARSWRGRRDRLGFEIIKVGVHQGLVLSPVLFAIVLEALSRKLEKGYPMSCYLQIIE